MAEAVAEPSDLDPWNLRMFGFEVIGDVFHGLANALQKTLGRGREDRVAAVGFERFSRPHHREIVLREDERARAAAQLAGARVVG